MFFTGSSAEPWQSCRGWAGRWLLSIADKTRLGAGAAVWFCGQYKMVSRVLGLGQSQAGAHGTSPPITGLEIPAAAAWNSWWKWRQSQGKVQLHSHSERDLGGKAIGKSDRPAATRPPTPVARRGMSSVGQRSDGPTFVLSNSFTRFRVAPRSEVECILFLTIR